MHMTISVGVIALMTSPSIGIAESPRPRHAGGSRRRAYITTRGGIPKRRVFDCPPGARGILHRGSVVFPRGGRSCRDGKGREPLYGGAGFAPAGKRTFNLSR